MMGKRVFIETVGLGKYMFPSGLKDQSLEFGHF
jgi:hypothetical protein